MRDAMELARKSWILARVAKAGPRGLVLFGKREMAEAISCYEHGLLAIDDGDHWTLTADGEACAVRQSAGKVQS